MPQVTRTDNSSIFSIEQPAPVSPFSPLPPVAPASPLSPFSPFAPVAPVSPFSPLAPVAPVAPVSPFSPGSPFAPFNTTPMESPPQRIFKPLPSSNGCVEHVAATLPSATAYHKPAEHIRGVASFFTHTSSPSFVAEHGGNSDTSVTTSIFDWFICVMFSVVPDSPQAERRNATEAIVTIILDSIALRLQSDIKVFFVDFIGSLLVKLFRFSPSRE